MSGVGIGKVGSRVMFESQITCLVVDDEVRLRDALRRVLEESGYECLTAESGAAALEILERSDIPVVLSDLNMPEMDGNDLLKRVKASPKTTDIPVVVVTSVGNPAKEKELMALGALAVLTKPVTPADLLSKLEHLISQ